MAHTITVCLFNRALVQLLSNLITDNQGLQQQLWTDYLRITESSDEPLHKKGRPGYEILCRLLEDEDRGISIAAQVLILNTTLHSSLRT